MERSCETHEQEPTPRKITKLQTWKISKLRKTYTLKGIDQ